jgi:hypothetical protein
MRLGRATFLLALVACREQARPATLGTFVQPDASTRADSGSPGFVTVDPNDDPTTCAQAAAWQSYVGCDYWPTVVANNVWSVFDFAVVVANAGTAPADVTVTGPGGTNQSQTVAPNSLAKIYLPWVASLKGPDADVCGSSVPLTASVLAPGAAYHLVSSVPVTVYQFNALEYAGMGGPSGKSWTSCPGDQTCQDSNSGNVGGTLGCYSFSNDSSLLLPSTTLTGNYRVTGYPGESFTPTGGQPQPIMGSYVAITATADATHVRVIVAPNGDIVASSGEADASSEGGTGVQATAGGKELDLTMNAGDVAELVTDLGDGFDLSGSLVVADQPVQVIAGNPCEQVPETASACDHLEQSVFPAETLGKRYFVTRPSGPSGEAVGHVVRFYGNVDGTTLTYAPAKPSGCPSTLDAGQVADCATVESDFEVTGSSELAVGTFMLGGSLVDPSGGLGDPSQSMFASVEQYRTKYVFLAPNDYDYNLIDVVAPVGTTMLLDGKNADYGAETSIADGYLVWRLGLTASSGGAHVLEASAPVGIQVLGYGLFTSYQYPAGLDLKHISPPPPAPPSN